MVSRACSYSFFYNDFGFPVHASLRCNRVTSFRLRENVVAAHFSSRYALG